MQKRPPGPTNWAYNWSISPRAPGPNADYTTPDASNYRSSQQIYDRILAYEAEHEDGLNGFLLLVHFGVDPRRTDKFYDRLDDLIVELQRRGYEFVPITEQIRVKN